jgi:hypothetical protein
MASTFPVSQVLLVSKCFQRTELSSTNHYRRLERQASLELQRVLIFQGLFPHIFHVLAGCGGGMIGGRACTLLITDMCVNL